MDIVVKLEPSQIVLKINLYIVADRHVISIPPSKPHTYVYVTGFDKTRLPHTSNSATLKVYNSMTQCNQLQFEILTCYCRGSLYRSRMLNGSYKLSNLSLVLSNPVEVTYSSIADRGCYK